MNFEQDIARIIDRLGYSASVRKDQRIDPDLLIISGLKGAAEVWVFYSTEGVELRINGEVPGFDIDNTKSNYIEALTEFLDNVFRGQVTQINLPLYSRITIGEKKTGWSGVSIEFNWPLGKKKFSPYSKQMQR